MGLIPGAGPQTQVKSPAQAAAELSAQASAQMQAAQQMMPGVVQSPTAAFLFGQQFQQQFAQAQSQSSMNPYAANMLGTFTQPSALPSAMMMTPASTGVFRPPMPYGSGAGGTPMSPMPVMPLFNTPFTPQLPPPSFRTPWEQEIQQRELRADQLYAMSSQAPRFGGMAAGYGAGALAGAAVGGRFGMLGRGVGAVLGGLAAHYSGFASGMGEMGMFPMRPGIEAHEMGLSAQRMSQDWVVAGPNLHSLGRGLSRDASMELGSGIQRLAESRSFKNETGGQFNRHDLMQIMQKSGQAGLMDFDQSVDRIQEQLRKVSRSVSRFMELTNDPDVNSVIRRMGQMHTFGMSVPEIENAASSMRSYSRAAGTTVGGLWQQGLPGAMTYQALGLSGGAGLQYGMYSAAAARQAVATGTYSNAELAMFGGAQGVAQRNMQAQGAFMSMPMFGAAVSSYGAGGWGMNAGALAHMGSGAGPQGMVMSAVSGMNAAVGAGGIGALAMMPLQQRQIQDQAARTMSPYEQTAMRFSMAADTGKFLGLKGAGGFAAGARMLYGDEVATQMMTEAANPEYWRAQRSMIRQERDDIARSQRQHIMDAVPNAFVNMGRKGARAAEGALGGMTGSMDDTFRGVGRGWRDFVSRPLAEQRDRAAGIITRDQLDPRISADTTSREGRAAYASRRRLVGSHSATSSMGEFGMTGMDAYEAMAGEENLGIAGAAIDTMSILNPLIIPSLMAGFARVNVGDAIKAGMGNRFLEQAGDRGGGRKREILREAQKRQMWSANRISGAATRSLSGGLKSGEFTALEKSLGLAEGQGAWAIHAAGREMAQAAASTSGLIIDDTLTQGTLKNAMVRGLAASSGKKEDEVRAALTGDAFDVAFEGAYSAGFKGAGAIARGQFQKFQERETGGVKRGQLVQSRNQMEAIRTKEDSLLNSLGFTSTWFTGREEFVDLAAKYSPTQTLAVVYNNAKGLNASQDKAWRSRIKTQLATDMGITDPKDPRWAKLDAMAVDEVERMKGVNISDKLRGNLEKISQMQDGADKVTGVISQITSRQISERTSGVMGNISAALGLEGGRALTDESGLMSLSAGDISMLGKKGFGGLSEILSKAQRASPADRQGKYLEAIRNELDTLGTTMGSSESLSPATGDEAQGLARSDKKLAEVADMMEKSFKYFTADAAKSFRDGAVAFNEAMQSGKLTAGTP